MTVTVHELNEWRGRGRNPFLFGRSFLRMLFIKAKALFMRFYDLSMNFVSMCLNIVLSHAFSE